MHKRHPLIKDEMQFEPHSATSKPLSLSECLERGLLISHDSKKKLISIDGKDALTDNLREYAIVSGSPLLYPGELTDASLVVHCL